MNNARHLIATQQRPRTTWREALRENAPLLLPLAHDPPTVRSLAPAGYPPSHIGGFALVASLFAYPHLNLAPYGEHSVVMHDIIAASSLPILVDVDDRQGAVKHVTLVVQGYAAMGVSTIVLADQQDRPCASYVIS
jgi:methylisocitrate lyase